MKINIEGILKNPNKLNGIFDEAINNGNKKLTDALIKYIKNPFLIYKYTREIVKDKVNDDLENIIAKEEITSYYYAKYAVKGPFQKGEDAIARNAEFSYAYALNILKGPFPKGEDIIAKDYYFSFIYAKNILKDKFPKGEPTIIKSFYLYEYIRFLKSIDKINEFLKDHPEVKYED
ncbi:MAG: hypothetical protein NC820_08170 [Candidatus Omnitrophica bacterium]|nr:hypothetical protein [Candidatus Omnitrophota bacterium]